MVDNTVLPAHPVTPTPPAPAGPGTYAPSYGPDFLTSLQHFESGGKNVANTHQGTSSGQAQGYNQITTGTWKEFGGLAYAPTPLQASREQQNAIAAKIPLKRWAPETLTYLRKQGFNLDTSKTLAENIAINGGKVGTAPPVAAPGTTLNTTTPAAQPTTPADLAAFANLGQGFGGGQSQQAQPPAGGGGGGAPAPDASGELQLQQAAASGNQRQAQIAAQAQALAAALRQQSAQPLSWSAQPFGSAAGPQQPGTTLTSTGGMYG